MGWDKREQTAFDVARHSIISRCPQAAIMPLYLACLSPHILHRPIEIRGHQLWCPISNAPMSTESAISRFCVPFLQKEGWALFVDCDIICLADISELFALANPKYAVQVVKHSYHPAETTKMDNQIQTFYERKNWSSVILWNCSHPSNKKLTRKELNLWPGRDLHAFKWLSDKEIGDLPAEWNHLVDVNPTPQTQPKLLHYTLGTPDMRLNSSYAKEWHDEHANLSC